MDLILKMEGELVELMCELNFWYKMDENGILYLKCKEALYRHIEDSRLFYNDLCRSLKEKMEFKRNRYDPFVFNKQTTDVDDLKVSPKSSKADSESYHRFEGNI